MAEEPVGNRALRAELRELAARLSRIEQHLGLGPLPGAAATPPALPGTAAPWRCAACGESNPRGFEICWHCRMPRAASAVTVSPRPDATDVAPPAERPPTPPPHPPVMPPLPGPAPLTSPALDAGTAPSATEREAPSADQEVGRYARQPEEQPAEQPVEPPARPRPSLEVLIGERWMAWVGAIVVVLAVAFFVKLAYDLGWWGRIPPLGKCLLAAGFGAVLVAAGEVAYRRIDRRAAVSLFAAGLGTLYLTAYATFRYFALLPPAGAFWLMLLVAALGFGITVRGNLLVIGVLSLLGGYGSPLLLAEQETFPAALPLYVSGLLVVALVLSALRPDPFRALRYVALVLHAVLATLWILREGSAHWPLAMTFMTAWWGLITAECVVAAARNSSLRGNPIATLLATAWYVTAGCNVLAAAHPLERDWLGVFAGAVGAVCAWIALVFGPGLTALRGRPHRALDLLAATLWAQTGVLVATAIGLYFRQPGETWGQTVGWLALGAACVEVGRRLPSRGVDVFGLLVGGLGVSRAWALDSAQSSLRTTLWVYRDVSITRWTLLLLAAVAVTFFIARRLRLTSVEWRRGAVLLAVLGTVQWAVLCPTAAQNLAATAAWLTGAAVLLACARLPQSHGYRGCAAALLVLAGVKWLLADALVARSMNWWPQTAAPLVNWPLAIAALVCMGWYALYRTSPAWRIDQAEPCEARPARREIPARVQGLLVIAVLFGVAALSFELERLVGRYEQAAVIWTAPLQLRPFWWSMLWSAAGLGTLLAGTWSTRRVLAGTGHVLVWLGPATWLLASGLAGGGVAAAPVLANLQFVAALVLAVLLASGAVVQWRTAPPINRNEPALVAQNALVAAALLVLTALSIEIDRALRLAGSTGPWPPWQARLLWWTLLWAGGGAALIVAGRRVRNLYGAGWLLLALAAAAWLTIDTVTWRVSQGVVAATPMANLVCGVGAALLVLLALAARLARGVNPVERGWDPILARMRTIAAWLAALLGLWLGSLELDRLFAGERVAVADPAMARQTALSVYWGIYAIGAVALGFWRRSAPARYAGLALLAGTLVKVLAVDLAHVAYVYRVLSLLATGLLFIATSVAYAKLESRLRDRP